MDNSAVIPRRSANNPGWTIYVYGHQVRVPSSEHAELHGKATMCVGVEKVECFMVAYVPWSRVANFITGEQDHRTDV